jgi:hypothetical protein
MVEKAEKTEWYAGRFPDWNDGVGMEDVDAPCGRCYGALYQNNADAQIHPNL